MTQNEFLSSAFRMTRGPEGLRIVVPVKAERFRTLLNFVWILVWAAGEVSLLLYLLGVFSPAGSLPPLRRPPAALFLAAFTLAGGFVLWRWLWYVGGREIFLVSRSGLTARREIWGVGHTRRFEAGRIRSLSARRLRYRVIYPSWGRMFIGQDGCEMRIERAGRSYAYGKGLEEGEAGDLVDLLKDELGLQVHRHPFPLRHSAFLA